MRAFLLPDDLTPAALIERLSPLGRLETGLRRSSRRTAYDTFDWRLHREGLLLEEVRAGRDHRLVLRPIAGGPPLLVARGPAPRFARNLPAGALRERLGPLLEPRALLPLAVTAIVAERILVRDPSGRTVARLSLESGRVGPPGTEPSLDLPPVLVVQGARRAEALEELLAGMPDAAPAGPDAAPAGPDALAVILRPLGRAPRDYTGRVRVDLDPALSAQEALRAILRHLLETMERNLPGMREDLDPEFLHDFRVAVRRTRSALVQIKGVLPPSVLGRFLPEFAWLQEVTGPARDLDVHFLDFPALRRLIPARHGRALAPLARLLERRRAQAHRELAQMASSPRFLHLFARWGVFLERPAPRRGPRGAAHALVPVREMAATRIAKLFRRALREGEAITAASPATDLHELRKTCKKLRYLLEFFQGILDREEVAHFVDALKSLQDNLGRHQDLQVQAQALTVHAGELAREGRARPSAFLAMGMLIERLKEGQHEARREFAARFREFARPANRKRLKRLLAGADSSGRSAESAV